MEFYFPEQFPQVARKLVVYAWLSAEHDLEQGRAAKSPNEWTQMPSVFYRSILRVVLVFARQLFELVKAGAMPIDRVDPEVREFRYRLTVWAWYEQGHDRHGRKLLCLTEHPNGPLRVEVDWAFSESPEWYQYKVEFLALAQTQVQPAPVTADAGSPAVTPTTSQSVEAGAQPRRRRGPRPDNEGHMRVAEILPADWETMPIEDVLRLLHDPPDGKAHVLPSADWQNGYSEKPEIPTYPDASKYYDTPDIQRVIRRRYDIGKNLLRRSLPEAAHQ